MSRTISTVPELWDEYTKGLNGNPSVQELNRTYPNGEWRRVSSEKKYYSDRKVLYDEIQRRGDAYNGNYDKAVQELEQQRVYSHGSLNWLMKSIRRPQFEAARAGEQPMRKRRCPRH